MRPGDIVAVNGGKISKNTSYAEQFMAVSTSPIILGNMPQKENEHSFEKVAFMGQIPISVRGNVNKGDYIIPSGLNDGSGIAVAPEQMTFDEYSKIVGQAWASSNTESVKQINVLVGISANDIGKLVRKLENSEIRINKNNDLENEEISKIKEQVEKLKINLNDLETRFNHTTNTNENK
jgi:hypothetical protein